MLGIPATVAGVVAAIGGRWLVGVVLFVGGYALQFVGHAIEGNRSGEELLLRRLLKRGCCEQGKNAAGEPKDDKKLP